jgi:hypothetical protein
MQVAWIDDNMYKGEYIAEIIPCSVWDAVSVKNFVICAVEYSS